MKRYFPNLTICLSSKLQFLVFLILTVSIILFSGCGENVNSQGDVAPSSSSWKVHQQFEDNMRDIFFLDKNSGWMTGQWGSLYITKDGGATWSKRYEIAKYDILKIFFIDVNMGWAVGREGKVLFTDDGGITWKDMKANNMEHLYGIFFLSSGEGWICGNRGLILHTIDNGITWEEQIYARTSRLYGKSPTTKTINNIYMLDANSGYAVGGDFLYTVDGGDNWQVIPKYSNQWLYDITFNKDQGYIVGLNGTILTSRDRGKTWNPQVSGTKKHLFSIHAISEMEAWVAGQDGIILHTADGGTSWEEQWINENTWIYRIFMFNDKEGWASGETESGGILLHYEGRK